MELTPANVEIEGTRRARCGFSAAFGGATGFLGAVLMSLVLVLGTGAGHGEDLLGERPPDWGFKDWMNSAPLQLDDLKGKVILVRWWTAPHCPYCLSSAPALNEFHESYQAEGLVVIGAYHHKSSRPLRSRDVRRHADRFGFRFPVAIDSEWETLRRWWLDRGSKRWTSVSFLLDREGKLRHVHPGGQYVRGDGDYKEMKGMIERLLAEKTGG